MRYAVIGAGVSGLAAAQMLSKENEVVVFEQNSSPGGLIRCREIDGKLFHLCGGHVFNTRRQDVGKWFWSFFNQATDFVGASRHSVVAFGDGTIVPYPVEDHIYKFNDATCKSIIDDFVKMVANADAEPANFEEFLKKTFGQTLYSLYFEPYNYKVWRTNLANVPLSWLSGKLPMPDVGEMLYHNICRIEEKSFVHSSFYYPKRGGSQFIADTLSKGLNVRYKHPVNKVVKTRSGYRICDDFFDRVVFCGNVRQLPKLLSGVDITGFIADLEALSWHGTTSVFCDLDPNPYSWIYLPDKSHESHRIICTGNFSRANNGGGNLCGTVEFTDFMPMDEIKENLSRIPFSPKFLSSNYEEFTYPIQHKDTRNMIQQLKRALAPYGFYLTGRFAEWEYYNMDTAIGAVLDKVNSGSLQ